MGSLKVMTFNIRQARAWFSGRGPNRWYRRRGLVFDVIRRHASHLIGLQEADPTQLRQLLAALDGYGQVAHRRYGGLFGPYAPFLFDTSRLEAGPSGDFWLAPDPDGTRTRAWDAAAARICTWAIFRDRSTGERFAALNSHFDRRGVEARRQSALMVADRLAHLAYLPRLFFADLNADAGTGRVIGWTAPGRGDVIRALQPLTQDALKELGAATFDDSLRYAFQSDGAAFILAGIPTLDLNADDTSYEEIHHKAADTLERVCIDTVEGGQMTKDLALIVGADTPFLTTEEFLAAVDEGLQSQMA